MGFDKRENGTVIFFSEHDKSKQELPDPQIKCGDLAYLTYKNHPVIIKIQSIKQDKFTGVIENEPSPYFNHQEEVIFWEDEIKGIEKHKCEA